MTVVVTSAEHQVVMAQLRQTLQERLAHQDAGAVSMISGFADHFFSNTPAEELTSRRLDDLYGATIALWDFIRHRNGNEPKIRVFNPRYEDHGWQASHTIVEIVVPDSAFLVDSVTMEFMHRHIGIHTLINSVFTIQRDVQGRAQQVSFGRRDDPAHKEALLHIEIDRQSGQEDMEAIRASLASVLAELALAVADFIPMKEQLAQIASVLSHGLQDEYSIDEAKAFLEWLNENHFTFLGLREYQLHEEADENRFVAKPDTAMGILRGDAPVDQLGEDGGALISEQQLLVFANSGTKSRIHRPAYLDTIAIRQVDEQGKIVGEYRLVGLFTSRVFNNSPRSFPIIGSKVDAIVDRSGLEPGGHNAKRLYQILETIPREELFQSSSDELLVTAMGILQIQERRRLRLFVRKGLFGRFLSCLIYTPRENYNTNLRHKFQAVLCEYVQAIDLEFNVYFTESTLARLHIVIRVDETRENSFDVAEVESRLVELARSWSDSLYASLQESLGEEKAGVLYSRYADAFSTGYTEDFSTRTAVADIEHLEELGSERPLVVSLYRALEEEPQALRFKLFRADDDLPLSDVLPMLENLGLRVLAGRPYRVRDHNGRRAWIHDFSVRYQGEASIELDKVKRNFQEAFYQVWLGNVENDSFNRLVLAVGLSWREVALLRAYARYFKQTGFSFSQTYLKDALVSHPALARQLVELFYLRFDPAQQQESAQEASLIGRFLNALEQVQSLDEDRILRRYLDMICGTLRTNFFQRLPDNQPKDYISLKVAPTMIPDLPRPLPQFEIFVYSPRVEGVHLRGGKVARGGLRWSDRREDFRTEVLGLVKAQQVKNAVIVPVGAKGGFVPKLLPKQGSRETVMAEVVYAYQTFIRGLLDITDNLSPQGEVLPPKQVVRLDDDDTYLVVAADKGTATFSDTANAIAAEYQFWLGDAFASGGSAGYDHKKMGITARGAWVSVQRHFRELGIDVQSTSFTVVGIGDMAGDVFGNGMLRSRFIQLVAAFNHQHIFIDPNPDTEQSFLERQRLFDLPRSSWSDYNKDLISQGGGVFSRSAKSIPISPQMKERFDLQASQLTPTELIVALLEARVDLLWNGGIGTYVKSTRELNSDVGDKANDALRINGKQLRARVIGEGGNLGFTQLGRIEYSLNGGLCNTDFIDNAGGVDCSDHEVNIKILLNDVVANGDMTTKQRNQLLVDMTDEVARLVLRNNYRQAQAISIAQTESLYRMGEYKRYIQTLAASGKLDRELEFIPSDEDLHERLVTGKGLMRPELSTLLSYTKAILKEELISSDLPDDLFVALEVKGAFPAVLWEQYREQINQHKLKRQIVATQVANDMINYMGITFVYRMRDAAGSSVADIARAYIAAREVFDLSFWWHQIEALDYKVDAGEQMAMMRVLIRLIRRATRWFLRNNRCGLNITEVTERFGPGVKLIASALPSVLRGPRLAVWEKQHRQLVEKGVPTQLATFIAGADSMLPMLGIIQAAEISHQSLQDVASLYFEIGNQLDLYWFSLEINELSIDNHWQALAREAYRDDLDWQQRNLTMGVLGIKEDAESVEERIALWTQKHGAMVNRWKQMVAEFRATDAKEFSMYGVALRELMDIAQATLHAD